MRIASQFGIKPDEFWALIPNELSIFIKGSVEMFEKKEEQEWWRSAIISSTIANFSMNRKRGTSYKPKDFMPKKRQTKDDMLAEVRRLNALFGGKEVSHG